jgi:hypothetical protein
MPLKSKAQLRKLYVLESEGKVPKGTAKKWLKHTKNYKALPERKSKKKASFAIDFCKFMLKLSSLKMNLPDKKLVPLPKLSNTPGTPNMVKELKTVTRNPYRNEKEGIAHFMDLLRKGLGPFASEILKKLPPKGSLTA